MTQKEIEQLYLDEKLTITDALDAFISVNAIIGVGLISLAEDLGDYIKQSKKGYKS